MVISLALFVGLMRSVDHVLLVTVTSTVYVLNVLSSLKYSWLVTWTLCHSSPLTPLVAFHFRTVQVTDYTAAVVQTCTPPSMDPCVYHMFSCVETTFSSSWRVEDTTQHQGLWGSFVDNQESSQPTAQEPACYMVVELSPLIRVGRYILVDCVDKISTHLFYRLASSQCHSVSTGQWFQLW